MRRFRVVAVWIVSVVMLVLLQLGVSNLLPAVSGGVALQLLVPLLFLFYGYEREGLFLLIVMVLLLQPFSSLPMVLHFFALGFSFAVVLLVKHKVLKGMASHTAILHMGIGTVLALVVYSGFLLTPFAERQGYVDVSVPAYGFSTVITIVVTHTIVALVVYFFSRRFTY